MAAERLSIQTKLGLNTYKVDKKAHIVVDQEVCSTCTEKWCLRVCPGKLYSLEKDGTIALNFEGCLECGTCLVACLLHSITWEYPSGGCGVQYRFG